MRIKASQLTSIPPELYAFMITSMGIEVKWIAQICLILEAEFEGS